MASPSIHATPDLPKAVRGKGSYLWDANGKRYIDGSGGPAVYCLGHGNDEVNAAISASTAAACTVHVLTWRPGRTGTRGASKRWRLALG